MREVRISRNVKDKITELEFFLIDELGLSEDAALRRSRRMKEYILSLSQPADHPMCRFNRWRKLRYRCAIFERDWVFAYEVFKEGVIIRDMAHVSSLVE